MAIALSSTLNKVNSLACHDSKSSASSKEKNIEKNNKTELSKIVGKLIAERSIAKGVKEVYFDRGSYKYHGRVKSLADAARTGGLKF